MSPPVRSRRGACHRATVAAGLPGYASDMRPVRGKCMRPRCGSRYAVVRVSIDFRDPERVDRLARTECIRCGHVWRRVRVPAITSAAGYQSVRLTLLLPATIHRWRARGAWHREGEDAVTIADADIGDLDEAARDHRARQERLIDRKVAARTKREAADVATHIATMATLARLAAMDAAREADDLAAARREVA